MHSIICSYQNHLNNWVIGLSLRIFFSIFLSTLLFFSPILSENITQIPIYDEVNHPPDGESTNPTNRGLFDNDDGNSDSPPSTNEGGTKLGLDTASGGMADVCASWTKPETYNITNVLEQCEDGKCRECYSVILKSYCIIFKGGEEVVDKDHSRTTKDERCTDWEPICSYKAINTSTRIEVDGNRCRDCTDTTMALSCRDGQDLNDTKIQTQCQDYYDCEPKEEKYLSNGSDEEASLGFEQFLAEFGLYIVISVIVMIAIIVLFVVMNQKTEQ
jgi:hypothetical protein